MRVSVLIGGKHRKDLKYILKEDPHKQALRNTSISVLLLDNAIHMDALSILLIDGKERPSFLDPLFCQ